jgi:hypothetical protein
MFISVLLRNLAGGMAQVVECLPSKFEALSSNHSTVKKKKINLKKSG